MEDWQPAPTRAARSLRESELEEPKPLPAAPVLLSHDERAAPPARQTRPWGWLETAVLAAYTAVVAVGISFHEAWADEAQAWLLARDNGWWDLMAHRIRYEGSPGLWHSILWVLARLHVSYVGMHWVSGAIAVAGIAAFLRWSPFPPVLKILLPLGFWLAYQDAVVARSYVVFAVLVFPAAALLRTAARQGLTPKRLLWLGILLGLIANLSFHGFVASIGLAIVILVLARRQRRAGYRVRLAAAAVILCCFWAFAVATVFPPSDVDFPAGKNLQTSAQKIWAALGSQTAKAELKQVAERGDAPRPGELPLRPAPAFQKTPGEARWHKIARMLSLITFPVSNFRLLALAACVLFIAQAIVFKPVFTPVFKPEPGQSGGSLGWIGLIPWALLVLTFTWMYLAPRHAGMIWEGLVATLWLTWPSEPAATPRALWLQRLTLAALVLVGLNQLQWTAHCLRDEILKPYAGDEAMARWLRTNAAGKRIAGFGYHSIGVEAWFHHRIYFNQPATYWVWSQEPRIDARAPFTIATRPDVIVVGGWDWSTHNADISEDWIKPNLAVLNSVPFNDAFHIIPYAEAHGYRITHRFCGHAFLRSGYSEQLCQVALQPVSQVGTGATQAVTDHGGQAGPTTFHRAGKTTVK